MTKNFNALVESLLAEMMPASMMDDFGGMSSKVAKKIEDLPGKSPHWGPLQKLSPETRNELIRAIISNVFTEKDNTYAPLIDNPEQLKNAIKAAVSKVAQANPEFKATGKWAVQFLADRLANKELLGNVKYTSSGGQEIKKEVTQKEMKAALDKALQSADSSKTAENPESSDKNVDIVYVKAADLSTDDDELHKSFKKLPDNQEMSWQEVVKKIGTSKGLALMDAGGLIETAKEREVGEEEDVPALDPTDDEPNPDLSNFDRLINPYFSTTKGGYSFED